MSTSTAARKKTKRASKKKSARRKKPTSIRVFVPASDDRTLRIDEGHADVPRSAASHPDDARCNPAYDWDLWSNGETHWIPEKLYHRTTSQFAFVIYAYKRLKAWGVKPHIQPDKRGVFITAEAEL